MASGLEMMNGNNDLVDKDAVSSNPLLQNAIVNNRMAAAQSGNADPMAGAGIQGILMQYYNDARNSVQSYAPQVKAAQDSMQGFRSDYQNYLNSMTSPEQQRRLDAQSNMAMFSSLLKPAGFNKETGVIESPWANALVAKSDADIKNTAAMDAAKQKALETQYLFGKEDLGTAQGNLATAQKQQQESFKDLIDYQKAIKAAIGAEWEYKVGPNGLWLLNKVDPTKNQQIDKNAFTSAQLAARTKVIDEANKQDDAFLQAANGDASIAQKLKENWIEGQMAEIQKTLPVDVIKAAVSPTSTVPSKAVSDATSDVKANQPARDDKRISILQQELADEIAARDSAPVGAERDNHNKNVTMIQAELKSHGAPTAPVKNTPALEGAKKAAEVHGEAQAKAEIALPTTIQNAVQQLDLINQLSKHPGKDWMYDLKSNLPIIKGTSAAGAEALLGQIQSKSFLQAFDTLRGAGAITEMEGEKATQAISRLKRGLPKEDFDKALEELQALANKGIENAKARAAAPNSSSPRSAQAAPPDGTILRKGNDTYIVKNGKPVKQ